MHTSNTPRSRSGSRADVQAGAELGEHYGRQPFGEDISILERRRYMENTNISKSNTITKKIEVNLHMLGMLMLNRVRRKVHGGDVVTVDHSSSLKMSVELRQELP